MNLHRIQEFLNYVYVVVRNNLLFLSDVKFTLSSLACVTNLNHYVYQVKLVFQQCKFLLFVLCQYGGCDRKIPLMYACSMSTLCMIPTVQEPRSLPRMHSAYCNVSPSMIVFVYNFQVTPLSAYRDILIDKCQNNW